MRKSVFLFLLLLPLLSPAQIINTIAGNGSAVSTGDGGAATAAGIDGPNGLVYDNHGNLYVTEYYQNTIRKVSPVGIITTIAGTGTSGYTGDGGPATNAQLNGPIKITIDNLNNLYFADRYNNCIRKITPSGIITTIAGNGSMGYTGDSGPATSATLNRPTGVTWFSGNLYVADCFNSVVRQISASGIISTIAGTGISGSLGDGGPATIAQLYEPWGVNLDMAGNIYVSDLGNQKIRKVNLSGIITTVAGNGSSGFSGDGGPATTSMLYQPSAVAFDSSGNMYIDDELNNRVRMVSSAGIITTYAGNGIAGFNGDNIPATAAEINSSNDLIMSPSLNLVVCDNTNDRVRIVTDCISYITGGPVNDTVVAGTIARYSVAAMISASFYQWQGDARAGFVNLANIWPYSGVNTDTLTINNTASYLNGTLYRCLISGGGFCTDTSAEAILIVQSNAGIAQYAIQPPNVYPNPAHDEITVQLAGSYNVGMVELFNEIGQLVLTQRIYSNLSQISLTNLPSGMYFLKYNSGVQSSRVEFFKN